MYACTTVGSVIPTLSVPGITASSTMRHCRKMEVVVAKDPMPRVSKNAVTNPVAAACGLGRTGSSFARRRTAAIRIHR